MTKRIILQSGLMLISGMLFGQGLQQRTFVYGEDVEFTIPIDITDQRPIEQIMEEALHGTDIQYRVTEHHVLLFRRNPSSNITTSTHAVHGYVTDANSHESLIGANIYCPALGTGTVTNEYGFFSLPLPQGDKQSLIFSYVGYESEIVQVDLASDAATNVALREARELKEVIVDSDRPETGAASTRLGATTLTMKQIQATPAMFGEADVIKALHLLPGVQYGFAGTTQMSVRGGNMDQNLYMLDGVLLYNVQHILGFESAFMPDAVKHVDFYRSSFPARYGGRLSSVTDVRTKDGDMEHFHGLVSVGLLSSHVCLEGPIVKNKTSFIVSARRSYADWLILESLKANAQEVEEFKLYFYDINAKINHKFSDTDRLYVSYYRGQDGIKFGYNDESEASADGNEYHYGSDFKQDIHWGNNHYSLRWNHLFSPSLFSNLTVGYNRYQLYSGYDGASWGKENEILVQEDKVRTRFTSGINDLMMLYDFDYHPIWSHHIKMGGSYTLHDFRPEVQSASVKMNELEEDYKSDNQSMKGHEIALYAEDDISLGERWQVNAGLRGAAYAVDGTCYPALEPRFSVAYRISEHWRSKASYSWMHQYVHQLTTSPLCLPTDLWVSVTSKFKPMSAQQVSAGIVYSNSKGWEVSAEVYLKKMRNVLEYMDGASYMGSSKGWDAKVASGNGRSRGFEVMANRTVGRVTGTLSYSLSEADRQFPDGSINSGRRYPYELSRRHMFNSLVQWQISKRFDVSAKWTLSSGGYGTLAFQRTVYSAPDSNQGDCGGELEGFYYSGRNNYHMRTRHQLDLGINYRRETSCGESVWNVSVVNAYFHKNQDLVWTKTEWVYGKQLNNVYQATIIPILPSVSYILKF